MHRPTTAIFATGSRGVAGRSRWTPLAVLLSCGAALGGCSVITDTTGFSGGGGEMDAGELRDAGSADGAAEDAADTVDASSCDGCRVDGACIADGERHPEQPCRVCDAAAPDGSFRDDDDGASCGANRACSAGSCVCSEPGWTGAACNRCTVFVDGLEGHVEHEGLSWSDALLTIEAGVRVANERIDAHADLTECEVWVRAHTYTPTELADGTDPRSARFALRAGVHLHGGFAGVESTLEERDVEANETILSGDLDGSDEGSAYHVVIGADDAVLDGFTITHGRATGADADADGAGMVNHDVSPSLRNLVFTDNVAEGDGGGMLNTGIASPSLRHVTFMGNSARYYAGGMQNRGAAAPRLTDVRFESNTAQRGGAMSNDTGTAPVLTGVVFTTNEAISTAGAMHNQGAAPELVDVELIRNSVDESTTNSYGGAMVNSDSDPVLTRVSFVENTARSGGAMHNTDSSPVMDDVAFTENAAVWSFGVGGAISNQGASSPVLNDVSFTGNSAGRRGGAIANVHQSCPELINVVFEDNTAGSGAGMYIGGTEAIPVLMNVSFTGNIATGSGGAIYADVAGAPIPIVNATFAGNRADSRGGAIALWNSNVAVTNAILWDNQDGLDDGGNSAVAIDQSIIEGGGYPGSLDVDPLFVSPPADVRLRAGSPAIGSGTTVGLPAGFPSVDLDGNPRIVDGSIDMGAYQHVAD